MTTHHLAIDLGAESGRFMLGSLGEGDLLTLKEVHRFPTGAVRVGDQLHWDMERIFGEVRTGLRRTAELGVLVASVSADSWGVDYVLQGEDGGWLSPTFHYRDGRTARGVALAHARVSWPEMFEETGLQFMPLNTVYQLMAETPERWLAARRLLFIADAVNADLGGEAVGEETLASTSMLYNPRTRAWSKGLCERLGLPVGVLPRLVPAGTRLGRLRKERQADLGGQEPEVVATCSHDTGAAVVAVPAEGEGWAFLSSGTWSLMGVELESPVISDAAREGNFTNEIGFGGRVRFLKNLSGLWLIQECRRAWAEGGMDMDYETLAARAESAPAFRSIIHPADPGFLAPDGMPERIAAYCREHGEPVPDGPGAMARCIFESLALLYRLTRERLEKVTGRAIDRLHVVGGGSRNGLLNRLTAEALQVPVWAGPVEATAMGNLLVQAQAMGRLTGMEAMRAVARRTLPPVGVFPGLGSAAAWDGAYARFLGMVE
jgi:rhamnulokinase